MIRFFLSVYSKIVSPISHAIGRTLFGSSFACRFTPTCSAYTKTAYSRYGIIVGTKLSLKRILRCNPFFRGGYDPVPDKIK